MTEQQPANEQERSGLSDEELEEEGATSLPDREAMSLIAAPVPLDPSVIPSLPSWDTMPVDEPTPVEGDSFREV